MELVKKLVSLFARKPVIAPPAPLYSDADFLEFVAAQTRKRTLDENTRRAKQAEDAANQLGNAA